MKYVEETKKEGSFITTDLEEIKNKIHYIRGQKVILDRDLAEIYGYELKRFNEQVQRNIKRFDEDFMFKLNNDEYKILKSQFATSRWGGVRKLPNVFTEQGIYMLMTVLKGDLAISQSKTLIRLFKTMKDIVYDNNVFPVSESFFEIESRTTKLETSIKEIKSDLNQVMSNFINPDTYKHFLILNGKKVDADIAYIKIYETANKTIYYIDNYVGIKTLELLTNIKRKVKISIFTDNMDRKSPIKKYMIDDFKTQNPTNEIIVKKLNNKYHDRYIVVDYGERNEAVYHCGASSKDAGKKITTITKIDDISLYKPMVGELLNNPNLSLK